MKILVTGGAGYIGSHIVKQLLQDKKYEITILDNLSTGFKSTIEKLISLAPKRVKFIKEDLSNFAKIRKILKREKFDEVVHLAAKLVVPESLDFPAKYYLNNTANTANLVDNCAKYGVKKFIFSSTAAVYGEPKIKNLDGLDENSIPAPINPYGYSKLFSEQIIKDIAKTNKNFKFVILRYFNVAGGDVDGVIGQSTLNATHLIKVASETSLGKREQIAIFGDDYDTDDGTCVRDYIHVSDLANAHIKALKYLNKNRSDTFNCGYGIGYSVKEVLETMKKVGKKKFKIKIAPRREGDPSFLISNNKKIKKMMGWKPKYDDLTLICRTAYKWEKKL